jgi:hypothetical protein
VSCERLAITDFAAACDGEAYSSTARINHSFLKVIIVGIRLP